MSTPSQFINLTKNHYTFRNVFIPPSGIVAKREIKYTERNEPGYPVPAYTFQESVKHINLGTLKLYKYDEEVSSDFLYTSYDDIYYIVDIDVLECLRNNNRLRHKFLVSDQETQVLDTIHSFLRV